MHLVKTYRPVAVRGPLLGYSIPSINDFGVRLLGHDDSDAEKASQDGMTSRRMAFSLTRTGMRLR